MVFVCFGEASTPGGSLSSRKFGFVLQAVPCIVFVTSLSCGFSCVAFVLSALVLSRSLNLQKLS